MGPIKKYVEISSDGNPTNQVMDSWYVDCGLSATFLTATTVIGGLEHLEGKTVVGLANNNTIGKLVVANGQITLQEPVIGKIVIGLPYDIEIETLDYTMPVQGSSTLQRVRQIEKADINFFQSGDFYISNTGKDDSWVEVRTEWTDKYPSGMISKDLFPTSGETSRLYIKSSEPTCFGLTSLSAHITIDGSF